MHSRHSHDSWTVRVVPFIGFGRIRSLYLTQPLYSAVQRFVNVISELLPAICTTNTTTSLTRQREPLFHDLDPASELEFRILLPDPQQYLHLQQQRADDQQPSLTPVPLGRQRQWVLVPSCRPSTTQSEYQPFCQITFGAALRYLIYALSRCLSVVLCAPWLEIQSTRFRLCLLYFWTLWTASAVGKTSIKYTFK